MDKTKIKIINMIKSLATNDIIQTALWIGLSRAVAAVAAYLLTVPEMSDYGWLINFVAYAAKKVYDRFKK